MPSAISHQPSAISHQPSAISHQPSAISHQLKRKDNLGFTLVEILSTVAIMAVLATLAMFFTANYVTWAKNTADKQTLAVLNDALTRYKCQGGDVNSLTLGAPIGNIITRLRTPVTWGGAGGLSHQFLQSAFTYPARSLDAIGERSQYHFFTAGSYASESVDSSVSTAQNYYPYGQGVAYLSNGGAQDYSVWAGTTTSYFAVKDAEGNITQHFQGYAGDKSTIAASSSITVWSCVSLANSTPSGTLTGLDGSYSALTSVNLNGVAANLTVLKMNNNTTLHDLNVQRCTNLQSINLYGSAVSPLDLSGLTQLTSLNISFNPNLTLNITGCTAFQTLIALGCANMTLTLGGNSSLVGADIRSCGLNATQLDAIYTALPDRSATTAGGLSAAMNPFGGSTPQNIGSTVSIATAKNWTVN